MRRIRHIQDNHRCHHGSLQLRGRIRARNNSPVRSEQIKEMSAGETSLATLAMSQANMV
jgi:hypothetical protein